jgi:N-acetylmuramoyl-L-alanine amidase
MPAIAEQLLPYVHVLAERPLGAVDLVVIHCTELPDMAMARAYGERVMHDSGAGNSGHYYIDRDGSTVCYVPPERVAHHCRGYNPRSVGIELVNIGRYPDWFDSRRQEMTEPYPAAQIQALDSLLATLRAHLPSLACIAGHEDLDTARVPSSNDESVEVPRKRDPGPQFPWARVLDACHLRRIGAG